MGALSEKQLYRLSQSQETRRLLDLESRNDARQREQERLERLEEEYKRSLKVGRGKLRDEWTTVSGYKDRHERTGRLTLDGAPVCDNEHLLLWVDGQSVEVVARYNYSGQLRTITGAFGDAETDETYTLKQGQRARRVETPEVESPDWHLKFSGKTGKWRVVKPGCFAGEYSDMLQAQELCDVLKAHDKIKPLNNDIHFRTV